MTRTLYVDACAASRTPLPRETQTSRHARLRGQGLLPGHGERTGRRFARVESEDVELPADAGVTSTKTVGTKGVVRSSPWSVSVGIS